MITKEKAIEIVTQYLQERKREYLKIWVPEKVGLRKDYQVLYGKRSGEFLDQYFVGYEVQWGIETDGQLVYLSADTGEILFSMNGTNWIEEMEDE